MQFPVPAASCVQHIQNCECLSRVTFLNGNGFVMIDIVESCETQNATVVAGSKEESTMNVRDFAHRYSSNFRRHSAVGVL